MYDFRSIRADFPEKGSIFRQTELEICPENHQEIGVFVFANGGFLVGLKKPPRNRNDLSDNLRILVISKLCSAMEIPRIRMEDEFVVFDSATCC